MLDAELRVSHSPKVYVSVVHWNGGPSTLACIESVLAERQPELSVVVVDNGSTDDIADTIESRWPTIHVVRNATNTGFTGGHNRGIEVAMSRQADYIVLLNQDAVLVPGCIARMIALAESDAGAGLVSPMIHYDHEPSRPQFIGSWLDRDAMMVVSDSDLERVRARDADPAVTMCLWGTALLIRRGVVEAIGSLDDRMFAYFEDTDYCVRAARAGWRSRMCFDARILHEGHPTRYSRPPHFFYFMIRNEMLFWRKALPLRQALRLRRVCCARAAREAAKLRDADGFDAQASACSLGLWDALTGRYGPYEPARRAPRWFHAALLKHPYLLADALEGRLLRALAARWTSTRGAS